MRFSEHFNIQRAPEDDWYDSHLTVDTKLFVDPLLMLIAQGTIWPAAHDELITHFVRCYELVARAGSRTSPTARMAHTLLTFPEPGEFCLGFTSKGTRGSGSGPGFAIMMADGIAAAIAAGLDNPEHIEEIGILNVGIGADRISDAVCNVLKHHFIEYTQEVARRHDLPTEPRIVRNAECLPEHGRWRNVTHELPINPSTGAPILLVPDFLLNSMDTLNAEDWYDDHLNDDLRAQMNLKVGERVRKEDIVRFARLHPERVRQWAREQTSRDDLEGYNFTGDPEGVVQWDRPTREYAESHPIDASPPTNQDELRALMEKVLKQFKHYIESQRGWSLLWNDDGSEKKESAAQLVFLGIAQNYMRMFDVEVDREVELGRGPADFKVSRGTTCRLIIEVKKAHNGKFWNGLEQQLPSYLQSDDSKAGWYLAIRYRSNKASQQRMNELPGRVARTATASGKDLRFIAIDGRRKVSASNLSSDSESRSRRVGVLVGRSLPKHQSVARSESSSVLLRRDDRPPRTGQHPGPGGDAGDLGA